LLTPTPISGSDILGRYYTKSEISSFLVEQLDIVTPMRLLDLGAGSGSLCGAAKSRWPNIEIVSVDIDPDAKLKSIRSTGASTKYLHQHFTADALVGNLPTILNSKLAPIDIAICNPPFITPQWRDEFRQILEDAGFADCLPFPSDVDAGLLFLAQNLRILSQNATLGIILPNSLIAAKKYTKFRFKLLSNYSVSKVIQLPRGSFHGTDALASIVIIHKQIERMEHIELSCLDDNKQLSKSISIEQSDAIDRLDYSYHSYKLSRKRKGTAATLESIGAIIQRGSLSSSQVKKSNFPTLHITNIHNTDAGRWINFEEFESTTKHEKALIHAQPGDILISRVGRKLEDKVVGVESGCFPISDCIYLIRCSESHREAVLSQLASQSGKEWLAAHSYGVAAKQLPKKQLLKFPLTLEQ